MDAIYRAAMGMVRNRQVAEDLFQETYREAWSSFRTYRPGSDCKAWLFRILFRVRDRYLHGKSRLQWIEIDQLPERLLSTEPRGEDIIEDGEVIRVIESLPELYRTVLILVDAEGFTYQEAAGILDVPIGTVMSRLNRGRHIFRERFLRRRRNRRSTSES